MKLKLKCINSCRFEETPEYGIFNYNKGDIVNAIIRDNSNEGCIRIQRPDGSYSFPHYISNIEWYFTAIWNDG